jgi:hypothetical protein
MLCSSENSFRQLFFKEKLRRFLFPAIHLQENRSSRVYSPLQEGSIV